MQRSVLVWHCPCTFRQHVVFVVKYHINISTTQFRSIDCDDVTNVCRQRGSICVTGGTEVTVKKRKSTKRGNQPYDTSQKGVPPWKRSLSRKGRIVKARTHSTCLMVEIKLCNVTRTHVRVTCSTDKLTQFLSVWVSLYHLQCDLQWRSEEVSHRLQWIIDAVAVYKTSPVVVQCLDIWWRGGMGEGVGVWFLYEIALWIHEESLLRHTDCSKCHRLSLSLIVVNGITLMGKP